MAINAQLYIPYGVQEDSSGNLFIADTYSHRIRKVFTNGTIVTVAGTGNNSPMQDGIPAVNSNLHYPVALFVDSLGNIFIADQYHHSIRKVLTNGTITTVAGTGGSGFGDQMLATNAGLNNLPNRAICRLVW